MEGVSVFPRRQGVRHPLQGAIFPTTSDSKSLKEHIVKALRHFHFQINMTAKFLGIDRKTLRIKMRNYGIKIESPQ
jgi:DNA-binding NtrC family response regulator